MSKIWLTSDTHFSHDKAFIWGPRGFSNVDEMNEIILENWNKTVSNEDTVYHLGDVILGNEENGLKYLSQLKGNIKIIIGNHDTSNKLKKYSKIPNIEILGYAYVIKYNKYHFYLSHYPTLTGLTTINLYGHTHQHKNFYGDNPTMYHVGVDSHNCTPVNIDTIIGDIKNRIEECKIFL